MNKKESFITAIKNNEGIIYKIASLYTNDVHDKDDLVQEIIYQLWKSFDSFDQRSALSTWMYRVSMNVAIYHLKISKRKVVTVPLDEQFSDLPEAVNPGWEEKMAVFRQHLNNLNLLDKGIVMLYLENKSYEEIAQITGISETNVGTRIFRIKEKLKNQITKQF
ncbi:MAG: RNA polymerase sigma factor [Ferruginibacter sp.]